MVEAQRERERGSLIQTGVKYMCQGDIPGVQGAIWDGWG